MRLKKVSVGGWTEGQVISYSLNRESRISSGLALLRWSGRWRM